LRAHDDELRNRDRSSEPLRVESWPSGLCSRVVCGGVTRAGQASLFERRPLRRRARYSRRPNGHVRYEAAVRDIAGGADGRTGGGGGTDLGRKEVGPRAEG